MLCLGAWHSASTGYIQLASYRNVGPSCRAGGRRSARVLKNWNLQNKSKVKVSRTCVITALPYLGCCVCERARNSTEMSSHPLHHHFGKPCGWRRTMCFHQIHLPWNYEASAYVPGLSLSLWQEKSQQQHENLEATIETPDECTPTGKQNNFLRWRFPAQTPAQTPNHFKPTPSRHTCLVVSRPQAQLQFFAQAWVEQKVRLQNAQNILKLLQFTQASVKAL